MHARTTGIPIGLPASIGRIPRSSTAGRDCAGQENTEKKSGGKKREMIATTTTSSSSCVARLFHNIMYRGTERLTHDGGKGGFGYSRQSRQTTIAMNVQCSTTSDTREATSLAKQLEQRRVPN